MPDVTLYNDVEGKTLSTAVDNRFMTVVKHDGTVIWVPSIKVAQYASS